MLNRSTNRGALVGVVVAISVPTMDTKRLITAVIASAVVVWGATGCSSGSSESAPTQTGSAAASAPATSGTSSNQADCGQVEAALQQIQLDTEDINSATSANNDQAAVAALQKEAAAATQLVSALGSQAPASAQQWAQQTQDAVDQIVQAAAAGDAQQASAAAAQLSSSEYQQLTTEVRSAAEQACNL